MTPQQRHIEAARTIVRPMLESYHVSPNINHPPFDPYEAIAHALAEAENRAAWDIHDVFFDVPDMRTYTAEKYGPRLEVKHE